MTTVKNVYDYINSFAPFDKQAEWDNSGVLAGDLRKPVDVCIVALDITSEVIELAKRKNAQLIVSHHPVIFSPLSCVTKGGVVFDLVQNDIAALCAHTNFDVASDGINSALAAYLKLEDIVPSHDGNFRLGRLKTPMKCDELAHYVKYKLGCENVRYTESTRLISTLALCGGSGSDFIESSKSCADAYLTGDLSYHNFLDAQQSDYCVMAAGHFETEIIGAKHLCDKLSNYFTDVTVIFAKQNNPIEVV